jgi:ComF family protein
LYCAAAYEGRLRQLIHLYKFHPIEDLDRHLGILLRRGLPPGVTFDCIVPTPIHWTRRISRGFNQAEGLAREVARYTGMPVVKALRKVRRTERQSQLGGARRRNNVKNSFAVPHPGRVAGKKVLLVDDVFTTGSTANSCASSLKKAGANYVAVLALARADRRIGAGPEAALAVSQIA